VAPSGGRDRQPLLGASLIALGLAIALVKPWNRGSQDQPAVTYALMTPATISVP
jgi:hypothetical protein